MAKSKQNKTKFEILLIVTLIVFVLCVTVIGLLYYFKNSPNHQLVVFRDRTAPEVSVRGAVSMNGQQFDVYDFVEEISDITHVDANYVREPDYNTEGIQVVIIRFTDEAGNFIDKTAQLEVIHDHNAPIIYGDDIVNVYIDESISYKSFVTVEDDYDTDCLLEVDNSLVDITTPGYYDVVYTATDNAGNSSEKIITFNVLEPDTDEYYLKKANELCDKIIKEITTPEMDDLHKVWAVYNYVRDIPYILTDYTRNYIREGYKMLSEYRGDCYGSYASVRLLLDRLGILNMPIQTDENYTRHFWNLVSLDGGETWYHVDATNWTEWSYKPVMCMICDNKLDEISRIHKGTHIHNAWEYPATPYLSLPIPADINVSLADWEYEYY